MTASPFPPTDPLPTWVTRTLHTHIFPQEDRYTKKARLNYVHVAILFRGRKILAIGQNRVSSRFGPDRVTIHAEADAIRQLGDVSKLRGATLVVIRLSSTGLGYSAPCPACARLIQKCQRVYGLRGVLHS
jgi:tRNA(Arg) A34 adenosine deaminase TadA